MALAAILIGSEKAAGELAPTVLASVTTDAVVVVRSVDRQTMSMEIESPSGEKLTVKAQSRTFDAIEPGSRFCVRLAQSVAVSAGLPGDGPSLASAWEGRFADKGARPAAAVVNRQEVQARVGPTNVGQRMLVLTGPDGYSATLHARPGVDLSTLSAGDLVVVRYSEALTVGLVEARRANCTHEPADGLLFPVESPSYRDTHTAESIRAALRAPIPSDVLREADKFDDEVVRSGQVNGRPVSPVSGDRHQRARRVVDVLAAAYGEDASAWRVRVLDSSPPRDYAFTVGGRNIYVFTGLLDLAESDDELAFVLAHEIAHSRLKHLGRERETFPPWLSAIMDFQDLLVRKDDTKDYLDLVAGVVRSLSSRVDEQEADALAAYAARRAGFDPLGGVAVFTRLTERAKATSRADTRSALLANHPANEDRTAALVAAVDYLRGKRLLESLVPLGQGFKVFVALDLEKEGNP